MEEMSGFAARNIFLFRKFYAWKPEHGDRRGGETLHKGVIADENTYNISSEFYLRIDRRV